MPRNYVRKQPDRKLVSEEQIARAKKLIAKGMSQRRAAKEVGVSEGGLRKRLKNNNIPISLGRFKPTLNEAQEFEFAALCKKMDEMHFGLTINDVRRLAYEFAMANNIQHRFNESTKMAGRDWVERILQRHSVQCLRQSPPSSLGTAIRFKRAHTERFYKNLKEVYDKYQFLPNKIYNMDETEISTAPKQTPKVGSDTGKKVVEKPISAERGATITAVLSMNVIGHFIPPAFIFPGERPCSELLDGGPLQSILMVSDSGFINSDLFIKWLQHFKYFSHPTQEKPVLLILDNHSSHISLEANRYACANHIVMVTLPLHGSHKLQPLDVAVHSPLKTKYAIECEKWLTQHPGREITQFQVASLFKAAFKQVATMSNAEFGFQATGIFPFADDLFGDEDFAPASVTDLFSRSNEPLEEIFIETSIENVPEMKVRNASPTLRDNVYMQLQNIFKTENDMNESVAPSVQITSTNTSLPTVDACTEEKADVFKVLQPVREITGATAEADMSLFKGNIKSDNKKYQLYTEQTDALEANIPSNIESKDQRIKLVDVRSLRNKKKTSRARRKSDILQKPLRKLN